MHAYMKWAENEYGKYFIIDKVPETEGQEEKLFLSLKLSKL